MFNVGCLKVVHWLNENILAKPITIILKYDECISLHVSSQITILFTYSSKNDVSYHYARWI